MKGTLPMFSYLTFSVVNTELRPKVKDHYRADKMALWSKLIPELLSNHNGKIATANGDDEDGPMTYPTAGKRLLSIPMPISGKISSSIAHARMAFDISA